MPAAADNVHSSEVASAPESLDALSMFAISDEHAIVSWSIESPDPPGWRPCRCSGRSRRRNVLRREGPDLRKWSFPVHIQSSLSHPPHSFRRASACRVPKRVKSKDGQPVRFRSVLFYQQSLYSTATTTRLHMGIYQVICISPSAVNSRITTVFRRRDAKLYVGMSNPKIAQPYGFAEKTANLRFASSFPLR